MNKKLEGLINAKENSRVQRKQQRKAIFDKEVESAKDPKELRSLYDQYNKDVRAIDDEIDADVKELRSLDSSMVDDAKAPETDPKNPEKRDGDPDPKEPESRGVPTPQGNLNVLGVYGGGNAPAGTGSEKRAIEDIFSMPINTPELQNEMRSALFNAPEYRNAFFKSLMGKNLTETEKRAMSTAANSGGAAVPTTTYDKIIKRMQQTSAIFGLIQKTYLPGNVVLPVANPQIAGQWSDSAPAGLLTGTDSDDTVGQVALGSYALSKFAAVKGQLLLMAIDAFESYIVGAISDQLAIAIEKAIISGTGSSQPTGILTGVTFDASNSLTWAKGGSVGYDDLVDARSLLGMYNTPSARWIMNPKMEAVLFKIKTSTNKPLFTQNPITGLIANPLGIPYVVDFYVPDNTIILANLDYFFMNINQNPTITSDDSAGYLSTSRVYRGTMYCDAKPALSAAFVKLSEALA